MENSENKAEEKRGGYREFAGRPAKNGVRLSGSIGSIHDRKMREMAEAKGVANVAILEEAIELMWHEFKQRAQQDRDATE